MWLLENSELCDGAWASVVSPVCCVSGVFSMEVLLLEELGIVGVSVLMVVLVAELSLWSYLCLSMSVSVFVPVTVFVSRLMPVPVFVSWNLCR